MSKILILHGPNLNLLGEREPAQYGRTTLDEINQQLKLQADATNCELICMQSNAEHELINIIQQAHDNNIDIIVINPGAYTHTSIAIRDALLAIGVPFIEVHLTNIYTREPFRKHSYFSDIAVGTIAGFGPLSYSLALQAAVQYLDKQN